MNNRRGLSLIEMVAAIGAISILAGLSVTIIHSLLRVERIERASLVQQATLSRLAQDFHRDARAAIGVEPSGDDSPPLEKIVFKLPADAQVEYVAKGDSIVRTERHAKDVQRTERFKLSPNASARLQTSGKPGQAVVSLMVDRKTGKRGEGSSREFRVDAMLGHDHRFAGKGD